MALFDLEPHSN